MSLIIAIAYLRTPNRYINYWLAIDKDIIQTLEGVWISPEFIKENYNPEDLKKPEFRAEMGLYSVAYGRSMKSLRPIFESIKTIDNINIGEPYPIGINGIYADFIYIELETDAKIKNKYFEPWDFSRYGIEFYFKHNNGGRGIGGTLMLFLTVMGAYFYLLVMTRDGCMKT